jgi:hypothetical protein
MSNEEKQAALHLWQIDAHAFGKEHRQKLHGLFRLIAR